MGHHAICGNYRNRDRLWNKAMWFEQLASPGFSFILAVTSEWKRLALHRYTVCRVFLLEMNQPRQVVKERDYRQCENAHYSGPL